MTPQEAMWAWRDDRNLTASEKSTWMALFTRLPEIRPSIALIAADARLGRSTTKRALAGLKAKGWLTWESEKSAHGDPDASRYTLLADGEAVGGGRSTADLPRSTADRGRSTAGQGSVHSGPGVGPQRATKRTREEDKKESLSLATSAKLTSLIPEAGEREIFAQWVRDAHRPSFPDRWLGEAIRNFTISALITNWREHESWVRREFDPFREDGPRHRCGACKARA